MEFRDLKKQYSVLKNEIDMKIADVCASAHFISGAQVSELEKQLAEYVGVKHCISCANGTDAITLALKAWGIGKGDAVFVPDFTFFSSGECPAAEGAVSVFVDVDESSFNIDPDKLEAAVIQILSEGVYTPKAVVAVDLFGQPADYPRITKICQKYGLLLLEDGAQGFGGSIGEKRACSFGDISTTSFFPSKPLGCYGDGGAVFTDNDEWAAIIRSLAVHGKNSENKYDNIRLGMNSRLDTLQAAVLQVKLKAFKEHELQDVNEAAEMYNEALKDTGLILPRIEKGYISSWAQYTVRIPQGIDRNALKTSLQERSVPTMIYYMKPMHLQQAFAGTRSAEADCPVTRKLCDTVLSLPIHPYLSREDINTVRNALTEAMNESRIKNEI